MEHARSGAILISPISGGGGGIAADLGEWRRPRERDCMKSSDRGQTDGRTIKRPITCRCNTAYTVCYVINKRFFSAHARLSACKLAVFFPFFMLFVHLCTCITSFRGSRVVSVLDSEAQKARVQIADRDPIG